MKVSVKSQLVFIPILYQQWVGVCVQMIFFDQIINLHNNLYWIIVRIYLYAQNCYAK